MINDARSPDRRRADLARIIDADDRRRLPLGTLALVLIVVTIAAINVVTVAQIADDVEATRDRVERMEPCRR